MQARDDLDSLFPAESHSAAGTLELGTSLAEHLREGDVIALYGELGAGKTVFARGICQALGVDPARVLSPTFTILHEYGGAHVSEPSHRSRHTSVPVYHFDAYRINRIDEFFGIGYEEYFYGDGISIVEWADKVEALLPENALRIRLENAGGDVRHFSLIPSDEARRLGHGNA